MLPSFIKITEHLRACANCGRGTFLRTCPIDLYCSSCWSSLLEKALVTRAYDYPFKVSSLLVWSNFVNPLSSQVENLIYSLKGGGLPSAFSKLAEQFAFGISAGRDFSGMTLVVPPTAREVSLDHGFAWGSALSEVLGLRIECPFEFATEGKPNDLTHLAPQKRLAVRERFGRQFKLKEGIRPLSSKIVFVDDLITSGATALAAQKALNSPVDFEVWTIARRPKLAGI